MHHQCTFPLFTALLNIHSIIDITFIVFHASNDKVIQCQCKYCFLKYFQQKNPFFMFLQKHLLKTYFQSQKRLYIHKCPSICSFLCLSVIKPLNTLKSSSFILHHSSFILPSFCDFQAFHFVVEDILTVDKELNLLELGVTDPIVCPALVLACILPSHSVKDQLCLI